jgi:hypothetical protein
MLLLLPAFAGPLFSEALILSNGWGIDPPAGWELIGAEDDTLTFGPPGETAYLQIKRYPGTTWDEGNRMLEETMGKLQAEANEVDVFSYRGRDARFADIIFFPGGGLAFRGYLITFEGHREDIVLMGITDPDLFDSMSMVLLSAMDSFSLGEEDRMNPGPVASYLFPEDDKDRALAEVSFEGSRYSLAYSPIDIEAISYLIEREAILLSTYGESDFAIEAWTRYYRMIYRDSYGRLAPLFRLFDRILNEENVKEEPRQIASRLLPWIQGFEYIRTGGVSDLVGPLAVAVEMSGDCDSRGLLLASLMNHLGIESVLMVSPRFAHSIVGIDVDGPGARFSFNQKAYLVAETTAEVDLGLIDAAMADPAGWIGIDFFRYSR